jgi:hypothetical protein
MIKSDPLYALEKLSEAVHVLATGEGRVQERLNEAATYLIRIRPEDLPDEELRPVLVRIKDDLTKHKEDTLVDALQTESDEDASAIAGRILDLYLRMNDLLR